jgi:penicillin-binding protein 1A
VWMGYPNGFRPMVNYRGLKSVQGGTIPAQLWHDYMAAAVGVQPQWAGRFPALYYLGGITLSPPAAGTVLYPEGLGTTTTTASSTTTTVPGAGAGAGAGGGAGGGAGASTTTRPKASTTTAPGGKPGPTTTTTTSSATTKPATTSTTAKPPHV